MTIYPRKGFVQSGVSVLKDTQAKMYNVMCMQGGGSNSIDKGSLQLALIRIVLTLILVGSPDTALHP